MQTILNNSNTPAQSGMRFGPVRRKVLLQDQSKDDDEVTIPMRDEDTQDNVKKPVQKSKKQTTTQSTIIPKDISEQDVGTISSPGIKLRRDTKQTILPTKLASSRQNGAVESRVQKSNRVRSVDARPCPNSTRQLPRTKAASVSPKKNPPVEKLADTQRRTSTEKRQTKLTAYGIRRTARQYEKDKEREREINVLTSIRDEVESGMKIIVTEEKGRGIVATRVFQEGEFVVEYAGDLIPEKIAKKREMEYKRDPSIGSYMFYFVHNGQRYCVDATQETPRLGRLINHSRLHPNCHVKVIPLDGIPRLVLFAKQMILPGEELLYDYGDRDKETLEAHPWLKT
ncbi:histone-lysine N-methyltransferase SETD8 [Clonorchis sinensis]|uniref:[histone H4]-lysine(20) N-methyltransferase n=1 Tax=Clonorchis sinensis TaxID=79923 RepID=G7Y6X7_CLOSI|nr:histone-lysine N-methyltransferase SETD8 [Clonorchis sinensis]